VTPKGRSWKLGYLRIVRTEVERFESKIGRSTDTACWTWTGPLTKGGYGLFGLTRTALGQRTKNVYAHRYSYERSKGPIPDGLQIDHLCRNRRCINPDHLEAVTGSVNVRRGEAPQMRRLRRTQCKYGHPFTQENTYRLRTCRYCKTCMREAGARYRTRKRQALEMAAKASGKHG
jgi:hypothetical protein